MQFGTWLNYWYRFYIKPKIRETTQGTYEDTIYLHIMPNLGDVPIDKLTHDDIQQFYITQKKSGRLTRVERFGPQLSDRTIRHFHIICHASLEKAVYEKWIESNPSTGCKIPPKKQREMQILSREELFRFLIQAKEEGYYELFLLEIATGLRRGELLALQWSDLNTTTGELRINKQWVCVKGKKTISEPKTKASIRTIVLPTPVVNVLTSMKNHSTSSWMFPSPVKSDSPLDPTALGRRFRLILQHANCTPIRFHDMRHTFATNALQSGMDVKTLSSIIGHVSTATTLNVYSHITDEMQRHAAAKLELSFTGRDVSDKLKSSDTNASSKKPFYPYKGKIRKEGCITEINDHLFEGRYTPTWPDGKRRSHNIYAKSREECEEKLSALIADVRAEIAKTKQEIADEKLMSEAIKRSASKFEGEGKRRKAAIAKYMFEHPEETRRYIIAQAVGVDRHTVAQYYDEIRKELDLTKAKLGSI